MMRQSPRHSPNTATSRRKTGNPSARATRSAQYSVTYGQAGAVCPQCGSTDQVHSIEEWAALAQANMGFQWQPGAPMPGYPAQPNAQPGYGSAPQPGYTPASPP